MTTPPSTEVAAIQQQQQPLTLRSLLGDADMDMLRDCFIALDHDGDGLISPQTIGQVVLQCIGSERYIGYEPYLLRIFEAADKDRDGLLSLIEFIECYAEGPGIVPQDVVAQCVSGVKIRMSDDEVNVLQKVFFEMDTDNDGLVGYAELEAALCAALLPKDDVGTAASGGERQPSASASTAEGGRRPPTTQRLLKRNKSSATRKNKYAHLTRADMHAVTLSILQSADRDGDRKINVSDFILSFQYDQKVIPLELIETKPESVLGSLTAEELKAVHDVLIPYLLEEEHRQHELNEKLGIASANDNNNTNNSIAVIDSSIAGAVVTPLLRPSSALQAPYGRLFTNLRTLLGHALSSFYDLEDVDAITDAVIAEGEEVTVLVNGHGGLEPTNTSTPTPSTELNVVKTLTRLVVAAAAATADNNVATADDISAIEQQQPEEAAQQRRQMEADYESAGIAEDTSVGAADGDWSPERSVAPPTASAAAPSLPPLPPLPAGSSAAGAIGRPASATAQPYPSHRVSEVGVSAAAVANAAAVGARGVASRPSSANTNKTYQQPIISNNANANSNRYAAYVHAPITTLAPSAAATSPSTPSPQPQQHLAAATGDSCGAALTVGEDRRSRRASTTSNNNAKVYSMATAANAHQKVLDPEAQKKVFIQLASNIIMTSVAPISRPCTTTTTGDDAPIVIPSGNGATTTTTTATTMNAFVQRLAFKDVKALLTNYLSGVFTQWSNEQVTVAAETLWSKAVSAGAHIVVEAADGNNADDEQQYQRTVDEIHGDDDDSDVDGGDDDEDDDGGESADMGFLTLQAFMHSYKVGGELTAVMADCTTFNVVNIGVLPLSVVNNIARTIAIPMNKIQRSVVRSAFIALLRAVNEARIAAKGQSLTAIITESIANKKRREIAAAEAAAAGEGTGDEEEAPASPTTKRNEDDPARVFCTTDVLVDDLRYALARALEPFGVFDRDPATAEEEEDEITIVSTVATPAIENGGEGTAAATETEAATATTTTITEVQKKRRLITLLEKIMRLVLANPSVYDNSPTTADGRLCVNLFNIAEELGIALPESMTAILSGVGCEDDNYDEYNAMGHKIIAARKRKDDDDVDANDDEAMSSERAEELRQQQKQREEEELYRKRTALTPYELAMVGSLLQRTAAQDSVSVENLQSMLTDIFIPPFNKKAVTENEELLYAAQEKIKVVMGSIEAIAGERREKPPTTASGLVIPRHLRGDGNGRADDDERPTRVKVSTLSQKFDQNPAVLKLGLSLAEGGVAAAIQGLTTCGLDATDLRKLSEFLVDTDRAKDGVVDLAATYREIKKLVLKAHPMWDAVQIDRPAALILNTAILNTDGRITLQPLIRACAAEYYLTPEKHSQGHSGALSRRLDLADLTKIRRAVESVSGAAPIDQQADLIRMAIVNVGLVGDSASLTAMVDTIIGCLRAQKITTERLAENLMENPHLLSFPIMLARDCHEVCLRKLKLSVPPEVLHVITRTLLLLDVRADGVLRRDEVDERLTRALSLNFGKERGGATADGCDATISEAASTTLAITDGGSAAGNNTAISTTTPVPLSPSRLIALSKETSSPTMAAASTAANTHYAHNIVLTDEKIAEIVRLIILSQFEQINQNRFGKPVGQSTTHANRNLEMNGFIELLVGGVSGTVLPRLYLPDVEVPFKAPLGYDELEILKGAIDSIAHDRRTAMTAVDLANLLESAMADRRRPFVKIIGDVMLKIADGPENSRFDFTELAKNFTITQKMLTFHTSRFAPACCDRVEGRVIRKEKARRLVRVFVAMDTNRDERLSRDELYPHLLADAHRTVTDTTMAKNIANARWIEIEALAVQHQNNNDATAASHRTTKEIAASNTRVSLETFLSTFCLGKFPAISEMEIEMTLRKAMAASAAGDADPYPSPNSPTAAGARQNQQGLVISGGAAHRLRYGGSARGGNAAGDYDISGVALPHETEDPASNTSASLFNHSSHSAAAAQNNNRARYLSARNLSDVPIFDDELQQEFNYYDVDGRGWLDRRAFERVYRLEMEYYGVRPSVAAVDAAFKAVCAEDDKVSFEEFCMLMLKRSKM